MKTKIALIAGATGLSGEILTQKLILDSRFSKIIVVTRKPLNVQSNKIEIVLIGSLDEIKTKARMLKADLYFCCLGTTIKNAGTKENFIKVDHDAVLELGKIAKNHNAEKFILISALGANPNSSIFYNKVKGQTEEDLTKLDLNSLVVFRPSLLMGNRKEHRLGESIAIKLMSSLQSILPNKIFSSLATSVDRLTTMMIAKAFSETQKIEIINARHI